MRCFSENPYTHPSSDKDCRDAEKRDKNVTSRDIPGDGQIYFQITVLSANLSKSRLKSHPDLYRHFYPALKLIRKSVQ